MEQYQYTFTNIMPFLAGERNIPCLLLTKDSTYTIYKNHHRYILHHKVIYESILSKHVYHTVIGKLYLVDDMGYKLPCENVPISLLSINNNTHPITYTDDKGSYSFIHHLDSINSLKLRRTFKPKRKTLIHSLPIIQVIFPLDTTIADQENVLIEFPFKSDEKN